MALRRGAAAFAFVGVVLVAFLSQGAALSDRDAHLAHQAAAKVCPLRSLTTCKWGDPAHDAALARKAFASNTRSAPICLVALAPEVAGSCVQANPRNAFSDWVTTFQKTYADGLKVSCPHRAPKHTPA